MPAETFETFKVELAALLNKVSQFRKKTIRDDLLRERFRTLFRTWQTTVRPLLNPLLKERKDFLKLGAELENLAKLTSKIKPVTEYRKRLNRAVNLSNNLVLYLPVDEGKKRFASKDELFFSNIPDLSLRLVPNPLIGWKSSMEAFVNQFPFDKSVFIMIKYRDNNTKLIKDIKKELSDNGLNGILASDHKVTDDLYNPIACLLCCARGIAIFDEPEPSQTHNPNVAYELGMLHLLGRETLILKHHSLTALHTDILMKLYSSYDDNDVAMGIIRDWVSD